MRTARSRAGASCRRARGSAPRRSSATARAARAPCRRSGRCRGRSARSPGASGRCTRRSADAGRAGCMAAPRRREELRRLRAETLETARAAEVIGATVVNQVMRGSVGSTVIPQTRSFAGSPMPRCGSWAGYDAPSIAGTSACSVAGHADDDGAGDRWRVVGLADVGTDRRAAQRNAARNGPAQGGAPGRRRPTPSRAAASARRSRVASRRSGLAAEGADAKVATDGDVIINVKPPGALPRSDDPVGAAELISRGPAGYSLQPSFGAVTARMWGRSSAGRALESHSRGRGFDSPRLHLI